MARPTLPTSAEDIRVLQRLARPLGWQVAAYPGGVLVMNGDGGSLFADWLEALVYILRAFAGREHLLAEV